jgi:hypothetical protein
VGSPRAGVTPLDPLQPFTNSSYMAQASIHFEPVKGGSEEHNKRLKFLDYVRPERTRFNEYWESDTQAHRLAIITQNYLDHHPKRKKLHAKATPIREAVVNITEGTTMDDLKKLAKRLEQRFGITIFQIAIHKDEGFFNSDSHKLNLHAHLVADWTNHENGESIKLNRQDMAEMQTITAEVLGMERGVSSDKKHLTAMQYKEQKAREEAERAKQEQLKAESAQRVAERKAAEAMEKKKTAEAAAVSGLVVDGTKKLSNLLGFGKEAKQLKELPQQLTAAREEGRTEGKKEAIAQVLKEANLNFGDKEVTPSMVGKDWRRLFDAAKQQKIQTDRKNQEEGRELANTKKSNGILKELVYSIWEGAREAVSVLCRYLALPHLSVSFDRNEVAAIDNALKNAEGVEERKAYGRDLVSLAHAEYPGYSDDAPQLSQLRWKVDEVAAKENRWQQTQNQERNQGRGL